MKKLNFRIGSMVIAALIGAIMFTSCKKDCNTCIPPPDLVKPVIFNLKNKSLQEELQIYQMNMKEGFYREYIGSRKSNEHLFDFIKEYCFNQNIPVDDQTISIVLYYNEPVSKTFTVTDKNVQGISVYCLEKRKLMHHLFVRNEQSEFYEIKNTKVAVPAVTHNHIHFYLENYVFENPQNKSYIIISKHLKEWENIKKYIRRTPIRFEVETAAKSQPRQQYTCMAPCVEGGIGMCPDGGYSCEGSTSCTSLAVQSMLSEARMIEKMFIDPDLMYDFRDNFLYNSELGEQYIDNYYYLSEEYDGKINLGLAVKSALFFKEFNPVMKAFINQKEHLNEIMFTDDLSNSLLSLLDEYEKITGSSEGKAILTSIRGDINAFRNKKLHEILAMIK